MYIKDYLLLKLKRVIRVVADFSYEKGPLQYTPML